MRCRRPGWSLFSFTVYSAAGLWLPDCVARCPACSPGRAGICDVLTGLLALPVAIAVATGTAQGRRAAVIWNLFGLADLAVAIAMGAITLPGRLQLIVPDVPSIGAAGAYRDVLTPAFVVPSSILMHALSLRQLYCRAKPRG
jgi:hypothetical protein